LPARIAEQALGTGGWSTGEMSSAPSSLRARKSRSSESRGEPITLGRGEPHGLRQLVAGAPRPVGELQFRAQNRERAAQFMAGVGNQAALLETAPFAIDPAAC